MDPDPITSYLDRIEERLDQIEENLDQLLDLARIQGFDVPEDPERV